MSEEQEKYENLAHVVVLDVFNTSRGMVAVLDFPKGKYPVIGTLLEQSATVTWKVTGRGMGTPSDMTNGYKHLDPPRIVFDCLMVPESADAKLKAGDKLKQL
jgi:hypothetical protein